MPGCSEGTPTLYLSAPDLLPRLSSPLARCPGRSSNPSLPPAHPASRLAPRVNSSADPSSALSEEGLKCLQPHEAD